MLESCLLQSVRTFLRFKLTTAISIVGLALGLTCFVLTHLFLEGLLASDQRFPKAARIYAITESIWDRSQRIVPAFPMASPGVGKYLKADFPALEAVARAVSLGSLGAATADRKATLAVAAVDPDFLRIFDLPFLAGSPATALSAAHSAVLTRNAARRLFGTTQVVGRHLLLQNQVDLTVTAVIGAVPQPSHMGESADHLLRFEMLVPMNLLRDFRAITIAGFAASADDPQWGNDVDLTYALLPANGSLTPAAFIEGLKGFAARHGQRAGVTLVHSAIRLSRIGLAVYEGVLGGQVSLSLTTGLFGLDTLILLIACLNYANLTVAVSVTRAREIGLKRVVGATRMHLVGQYLLETALLGGAALVLVLAGVAAALPLLNRALGLDLSLASLAQPELWLMVLGLLAAVTGVGGAYPALVLSSIRPIDALRAGAVRAGPRFVPTVLVGVQFAAASFLLLAVLLMVRQNALLQRLGIQPGHDPVVVISNNLAELHVKLETLRSELTADPDIRSVSAASSAPWTSGGSHFLVQASPQASSSSHWVIFNPVAHDFFSTFGIKLLAGRAFDRLHDDVFSFGGFTRPGGPRTGPTKAEDAVIIDRTLAREMGWPRPADAVGRRVYDREMALPGQVHVMRIIGVAEDGYPRLSGPNTDSNLYVLAPAYAGVPVIRVARDGVAAGLAHIDAVWDRLVPRVPLQRSFADELFNAAYSQYAQDSQVMEGLAVLAFLIAVMGLFGMAIHVASRRTREIGIRKTLGASVPRLTFMLLTDFARPVVIANLLAWPLGYIAGTMYLELFVQRTPMTPWPFAASLVLTLGIAWLAVGGQAIRAATVKPARVLYQE